MPIADMAWAQKDCYGSKSESKAIRNNSRQGYGYKLKQSLIQREWLETLDYNCLFQEYLLMNYKSQLESLFHILFLPFSLVVFVP